MIMILKNCLKMKKSERERYLKDLTELIEYNPTIGALLYNYLLQRYSNLPVLDSKGMAQQMDYLIGQGDFHVIIHSALGEFGKMKR
jgi:hypothetical protein